jgi:hypothetical protein
VFQWNRGEDFRPGNDFPYEDVAAALESGELTQDRSGEAVYAVNEEKPRVSRATESLRALREFAEHTTPEFAELFEQKYDDNFDVTSRDFWDRSIKRRV